MDPTMMPPQGMPPPQAMPPVDPTASQLSPELLALIQSDPALLEAILGGRVPTTPGNPGALPPGMGPPMPGPMAQPMNPLLLALLGSQGGMGGMGGGMPPMGGGGPAGY